MVRDPQRSDRRRHRWYLDLGIVDASQDAAWREKLFAAPLYKEFPIDSANTTGLPATVAAAIRRHGLSYLVCRVPRGETPFEEDGWEGCAFFRFQAKNYPDVVNFSANPTDVL